MRRSDWGTHQISLQARSRNAEVDLHIGVHDAYGKGVIKKMKVSPDAWIQLAFQLAYLRDQGSFGLTCAYPLLSQKVTLMSTLTHVDLLLNLRRRGFDDTTLP